MYKNSPKQEQSYWLSYIEVDLLHLCHIFDTFLTLARIYVDTSTSYPKATLAQFKFNRHIWAVFQRFVSELQMQSHLFS